MSELRERLEKIIRRYCDPNRESSIEGLTATIYDYLGLKDSRLIPLSLLKKVEWSGVRWGIKDGEWKECCPSCSELEKVGHSPTCELGKLIGGS